MDMAIAVSHVPSSSTIGAVGGLSVSMLREKGAAPITIVVASNDCRRALSCT